MLFLLLFLHLLFLHLSVFLLLPLRNLLLFLLLSEHSLALSFLLMTIFWAPPPPSSSPSTLPPPSPSLLSHLFHFSRHSFSFSFLSFSSFNPHLNLFLLIHIINPNLFLSLLFHLHSLASSSSTTFTTDIFQSLLNPPFTPSTSPPLPRPLTTSLPLSLLPAPSPFHPPQRRVTMERATTRPQVSFMVDGLTSGDQYLPSLPSLSLAFVSLSHHLQVILSCSLFRSMHFPVCTFYLSIKHSLFKAIRDTEEY